MSEGVSVWKATKIALCMLCVVLASWAVGAVVGVGLVTIVNAISSP
jgi:hypothetical protein